jgi:toxin ParE1/3/4
MNQCILSPKALRDLNDISSYFAQQNIEAGERVLALFTEKCTRLIGFPKMGKSYEFLRSNIRGIPLEGYIIFYRVIETDIIILRVVSGRQNLVNLFVDDDEDN